MIRRTLRKYGSQDIHRAVKSFMQQPSSGHGTANSTSGILTGVSTARPFDPSAITRPDERLMKYYAIVALLSLVAFPITLFVLWIKYRTLRYRFDEEGIWRAQGLLWRSEVNITYRRIQDIHLTNGLLQRWMGLSTVSIQTAAGSSSPEVTIEGVLEAEALRDFLYTKMRGVRDRTPAGAGRPGAPAAATPSGAVAAPDGDDDEALALLIDIRDALRRLEARASGAPAAPSGGPS
jgi:putative membrane protein